MKAKEILVKIAYNDGEEELLDEFPILAYATEDGTYIIVHHENLDVYYGKDLLQLAKEVFGDEVVRAEVVEE
jgi:hypothetical protein